MHHTLLRALFIAFLFMLLAPMFFAHAAWFDANWTYRVPITINSAEIDSTLTNFPVYVDLGDLPTDFHSNVREDGCDIRITQSNGTTETPFEIVSYSASTDSGELHFLASSLSAVASTTFYLYYGNSAASCYATDAVYGAENVWTQYAAVWHMQDAPTGSSGDVVDSTGNGHNLTSQNSMGAGDLTAGKLAGNGYQFTTDDWLNGGDILDMGTSDMTISTWFNTIDTDFTLVAKSFYGGDPNRYAVGLKQSSDAGIWSIFHGTSQIATPPPDDTGWNDGSWHHYVSRFDRDGNIQQFFDATAGGLAGISAQSAHDFQSNFIFIVGGYNDSSGTGHNNSALELNGAMDEVRFSYSALSDDWVSAEYSNQSTPGTFYNIGAQDALVAPTVTTEAPSAVEKTTATGNGTIVDADEEVVTERGFVVATSAQADPGDTDPDASTYPLVFDEIGSFGLGAFTGSLAGLDPSTTHYVRAYARNAAGFGYGNEETFTTLDLPGVQFSLGSSTLDETDSPLTLIIELSAITTDVVTVNLALSGTATNISDFTLSTTTLTISPGSATTSVTVTPVDDDVVEGDETIVLTLENPTNATLGATDAHTVTLTSDDVPTIEFSSATSNIAETDGPAGITIQLSATSTEDVSVVITLSGTATEAADFTLSTTTPTIAAGNSTTTVTVTPIDDNDVEEDETIILTLGSPTNANLGSTTIHTVTLTSDDVEVLDDGGGGGGGGGGIAIGSWYGPSVATGQESFVDIPQPTLQETIVRFFEPLPRNVDPVPIFEERQPEIMALPEKEEAAADADASIAPKASPKPFQAGVITRSDKVLLAISDGVYAVSGAVENISQVVLGTFQSLGRASVEVVRFGTNVVSSVARDIVDVVTDGPLTVAEIITRIQISIRDSSVQLTASIREAFTASYEVKNRIPPRLASHRYEEVIVRVVDAVGVPLAGASLALFSEPQYAVTDETGSASFKDVPAGEHTLKIAFNTYRGEQKLVFAEDAPRLLVAVSPKLVDGVSTATFAITTTLLMLIIAVLGWVMYRRRRLA